MTRVELREFDDFWQLPFDGKTVTQCRYDYAFSLVINESDVSVVVRISEAFLLSDSEGLTVEVNPEGDPRTMAATLRILHSKVTRSVVRKDGRLEIDFDEGTLIRVPSARGYEPWEISGPDGPIIAVNTDGQLVVWR